MTEIVNGEIRYNELTKNSNGGTELIARRMLEYIPRENLEGIQIIHSRVRELEPDLKRILVLHDLATDPEVKNLADPEYRNQFDKFVFVSNWQQHTYNMVLGVPFSKSVVIPNAITPIKDNPATYKRQDDVIHLIYHTTPHRGLALLLPAFKELSKHFNVHLDVFSSFKIYGWDQRDQDYQVLFEELDRLPNVTNHGFQSNDIVRDALLMADIFAFPSCWVETSCLALIEAMCSGCFSVHSNLGALPETASKLTNMYMYSENNQQHLNQFYHVLYSVTSALTHTNKKSTQALSELIATQSIQRYDFESVAKPMWISLLNEVKRND